MSLELLLELDERRAFEATHRYEDLEFFHVRFDNLTGSEGTEHALRQMATRNGRVALIGPSGSGKSSVIASVLGPLVEDLPDDLVPIRIPVAAADAETVTEPRLFAQHIVRMVARYSTEILTPDERKALEAGVAEGQRRRGRERTRGFTAGAPQLLADLKFTSQVKSEAEEIEERLSTGGAIAELARLPALFRSHRLELFLVIDDSDKWLQIGGTDLSDVANEFFVRNAPVLAKELDCGFVLAIHDHYLDLDGFKESRELFSTEIRVPQLDPATEGITRILDRRIELAEVSGAVKELFEPDAVAELAERYDETRSLRRVLAATDRAVQHACSDGVAPVSRELVRTALADLT